MSKIKLVNENGKIVARDVDTGDIVPIEFGSDALAQNLDLQYSYDIQNAKAVDAQSVSAEEGTIDKASINENQSLVTPLGQTFEGSAVDSEKTYYTLETSSDPISIYSTDTPRNPSSWDEINTLPRGDSTRFYDIHVTQNDTLLVGTGGAIYRSTDGGSSFSSVYSLTKSNVWAWAENSSGTILCAPRGGMVILKSTDDGVSWTTLADSNDFQFNTHVHKVAFHPDNDWIIVTGGDGGGIFYRSTDGGSTWDEYSALMGQYAAIAPHPTDGNTYFFAHDFTSTASTPDVGIVKVSDDGSNVSQKLVHNLNPERQINTTVGSYSMRTVYDSSSGNGYYFTSTLGLDQERIFASEDLAGEAWRSVGHVSKQLYGETTTPSAYGPIDPSQYATAVGSDIAINLLDVANPLYGATTDVPLDNRRARDTLDMGGESLTYQDEFVDSDLISLMRIFPSTGTNISITYQYGAIFFRDASTGNVPFRVDVDNAKVQFEDASFLDLYDAELRGVRSSSSALSAGDLSTGEIALDEANGRIVWKDGSGSAYYVSGSSL